MPIADITKFKEILPGIKSVLVILPQNPSFDAVSAGLSLFIALRKKNIVATTVCPSEMTVEFNRLVGVNKVHQDLGNKNLVITFSNYPVENVERVGWDADNGKFSLTVVPKPGSKPPRKEEMSLNYSGVAADLIVAVGANYPDDLGRFAQNKEILEQESLALLANRPLSGWPNAIELIDTNDSSLSEVAYDVITQSDLQLDEDLATNLFLGIEAGTSNFTKRTATADTFDKVAKLLRAGAQRSSSAGQGEEQKPPQDWLKPKVYKGSTLP